jgi:hypothetical protein
MKPVALERVERGLSAASSRGRQTAAEMPRLGWVAMTGVANEIVTRMR